MFVIKGKQQLKENEYEVNGNIAHLKLQKKDGSSINATIDAESLPKVLEKGIWFARWHKDFNNYLVQTLSERNVNGEKHMEKQTIQSFLMNVHTKEPIRHINGDTLDNRRCNLEIYKQNTVNDIQEIDTKTSAIILRDKYGKENARTLIDKEDLERVIQTGYCWVCYKLKGAPYAVANTPDGRVFLNRYIMQTPQNKRTHAINLNTLDNRKVNLEHVILFEENEAGDNSEQA